MIRANHETPVLHPADIAEEMREYIQPFAGTTIVVTGKLKHFTRASIHAEIEALGAKAGRTVSKKTDYLIYGERAGSKLGKALSLGIRILTEEEFLIMARFMIGERRNGAVDG